MAEDVAHESNFQRLTRLGFAARGFLYILIAALVILTGEIEDLTGALKYVGHGLGKALLAVLAIGMAAYGLWRLSDAGSSRLESLGKAHRARDQRRHLLLARRKGRHDPHLFAARGR